MKKFRSGDEEYRQKRKQFATNYGYDGLWFIADQWPMFAGVVNISRFLAIYELVKKVIHLPGHFCELGCWHGSNLVYLAKLITILKPQSYTEVFGFDSFEGLKTFEKKIDPQETEIIAGSYKGNQDLLEAIIRLYNIEETVTLIKGNILDTLAAFLETRKDIRFSFVYMDVDLYPPTKVGIELLYPRLLNGGIMAFDQYNLEAWPGETRAVHEVLGEDVQILSVPFARQPTAYIVKS